MSKFKTIGAYFRIHRKRCGLTQDEVRKALGYTSKQLVSNWERGMCLPPKHQVSSLITLFKLNRKAVLDLYIEAARIELCELLGVKIKK